MAKATKKSEPIPNDSELHEFLDKSGKLVSVIFSDFDSHQATQRVENLGELLAQKSLTTNGVAGFCESITKFKESMVDGLMHSSLDRSTKIESIKSVVSGVRRYLAYSVKQGNLPYEDAAKVDELAVSVLSNSNLKPYAEVWMDAVKEHINSDEFIQKVEAIKKNLPKKKTGCLEGLANGDAAIYLRKFSLKMQDGASKPKGPSM